MPKTFVSALAGIAVVAAGLPALAQSEPAPIPTPAPVSAEPYSTTDTEIAVLIADPGARAVLDKFMPGMAASPMTKMVAGQTLKSIQGYGAGTLTDELLARIDAELAKVVPSVARPALPPGRVRMTTDENKVRSYSLPDPLVTKDGRRIRTAAEWTQLRRPEVLRDFETLAFGRAPGRPTDERFELFDPGTPAIGGKALRRQGYIHLGADPAAPKIQFVEYLPAGARKRVPMVVVIGFSAPRAMIDDPGIRISQVWNPATKARVDAGSMPGGKLDVLRFLAAGMGVTTYYYGDVDPDFPGGYPLGIRSFYGPKDEAARAPDAWGAIGAWAWSLSRMQDYLETDRAVDARRVAIVGASRLGRTVLWAAASDTRFAAVVSCCSGKLGASLLRRNYGARATEGEGTDYWFAPNSRRLEDDIDALPIDGHLLLSLIAPRAVLLQTGKYDRAADPKGEFLGAVGASPVYELMGKQGLGTNQWPPTGPILNDIGFTINDGGHGVAPGDWDVYLEFLKKHLRP